MGTVNKENWGEDIEDTRNLFSLLMAWINPICLDSKLREWKHNALYKWITVMLGENDASRSSQLRTSSGYIRKIALATC